MLESRMKTKTGEKQRGQKNVLVEVTKGGVVGLGVVSVLLCVLGMLIYRGVLGWRTAEMAILPMCLVGGMTAGFVGCGRNRGGELLCGAVSGIVVLLMLLSVVVLLPDMNVSAGQVGIVAALCLCGGALAGMLSRRKKKKRR